MNKKKEIINNNNKYIRVPYSAMLYTEKKLLSKNELAVLCAICSYADEKNMCYPSIASISGLIRARKSLVVSAINKLVELKLIEKKKRYSQSTIYQIFYDTNILKEEKKKKQKKKEENETEKT